MDTAYQFSSPDDWVRWLRTDALPLWSQTGFDADCGLVHEALSHDGMPLPQVPRRFRVQARQAYVFALCAGLVDGTPLADQLDARAKVLFQTILTRGFDPQSGHLVQTYGPRGEVTAVAGDLYDLAFVFLACSAGLARGYDVDALVAKADAALDSLRAPRGWHEDAQRRQPRRQNPHMHLFEAATAMAAVTRSPRYRAIAQECLDLFADVFLQPDFRVFEFFDDRFAPVAIDAQAVEPGHMAEWVGLIRRHEQVSGQSSGIDLGALFTATEAFAINDGLELPDSWPVDRPAGEAAVAVTRTLRLWPQTEWIKAHSAMRGLGHSAAAARLPRVLATFARNYANPAVRGGWFDQRNAQGTLLSTNMPASTMYHIVEAIYWAADLRG